MSFVEQALADAWALEAQKFVGYWHGVEIRGTQLSRTTLISDTPWVEPLDETDDCIFCSRMTPESCEARILGFQHELDNEVARINSWMRSMMYELGDTFDEGDFTKFHATLLRAQELEPKKVAPFVYDFLELPFYLKWRLCVRWNHLLLQWLTDHPAYTYDFEQRLPVLGATGESLDQIEEREILAEDIAYAQSQPPFVEAPDLEGIDW